MEFKKISLKNDATGRYQSLDKRIASVTMMFQSGTVQPEIARDVIRRMSGGESVDEIETTALVVKPLE